MSLSMVSATSSMLTSSSIDAADRREVTLDTPVWYVGAFGAKIGVSATMLVEPSVFCKLIIELGVLSWSEEMFDET